MLKKKGHKPFTKKKKKTPTTISRGREKSFSWGGGKIFTGHEKKKREEGVSFTTWRGSSNWHVVTRKKGEPVYKETGGRGKGFSFRENEREKKRGGEKVVGVKPKWKGGPEPPPCRLGFRRELR